MTINILLYYLFLFCFLILRIVRNVTMMFIRLPMGDANTLQHNYHDLLQDSCVDIIQAVANFDGMLAHLSYDDKGVSFFYRQNEK